MIPVMIKWASTRENMSSVAWEQQRRRPACASAQTDKRLCYSLIGKYHIKSCCNKKNTVLASLCSWAGWYFVAWSETPKTCFLASRPKYKNGPVSSIRYYKNISGVWGRDRQIRPEDHRLASRGLPSDDKGTDFCEDWDRNIRPEDHRLASRGLTSDDKRWSRGTDFWEDGIEKSVRGTEQNRLFIWRKLYSF